MSFIWNSLKKYFVSLIAASIIGSGWSWYHTSHRQHLRFLIITAVLCCATFIGYHIFKYVFTWAVRKLRRHHFWHEEFIGFLDEFFFIFSLLFVIFFFRSEVLSIVYVTALIGVLYFRTRYYLSHHPGAAPWLVVNRAVFTLATFLFIVQSVFQYSAHYYYILDANARFFNIVVFRSVAMTLFWLSGFAIASFLYWKLPRHIRYAAVTLWSLIFVGVLVVWVVNIATLYYSGLYFSPVVLEHASGGGDVINTKAMYSLVILGVIVFGLFIACLRRVALAHRAAPRRYWYYYTSVIVLATLAVCLGLSSFQSTPERIVATSFYERYFGSKALVTLDPVVQKKLEKFVYEQFF